MLAPFGTPTTQGGVLLAALPGTPPGNRGRPVRASASTPRGKDVPWMRDVEREGTESKRQKMFTGKRSRRWDGLSPAP